MVEKRRGDIMVKVGSKIRIISDNENYDGCRGEILTVCHVAYDRAGHPGYDEGCYPQALVDCEEIPFSLYEYEFEEV